MGSQSESNAAKGDSRNDGGRNDGGRNDGQNGGRDEAEGPDRPSSRGLLARLLGGLRADSPGQGSDSPAGGSDARAVALQAPGLQKLRRMRVDDVAIPKVDIVAVSLDLGKEELVEVFRSHGFSRLPVYKGTLDHPQGLLLLKDLALTHGFGASGRFSLKKLLRPILFVPPSMPAAALLQKMQRDRVHMALVIDEYGGVDGLVTIEDLIEVVIGEIEDEHDEEEGALWVEESPGVLIVQAQVPLEEVEAALGLSLREGDEEKDKEIDTLGGLIFLRTGRVPVRGEVVAGPSGVEFEVLDADPRRIKKVRVRLASSPRVATADAGKAAEAAAPGATDAAPQA